MRTMAMVALVLVGCGSEDSTRRPLVVDASSYDAAAGAGGAAGAAGAAGQDAGEAGGTGGVAGSAAGTGGEVAGAAGSAAGTGGGGTGGAAGLPSEDAGFEDAPVVTDAPSEPEPDVPTSHGACWYEPTPSAPACHNPCVAGGPMSYNCPLPCNLTQLYFMHAECFVSTWSEQCKGYYVAYCGCGSC